MFRQRVLGAVIVVLAFVALMVVGQPWYSLLIAVWVVAALHELYRMLEWGGIMPLRYLGFALAVGFVALAFFHAPPSAWTALVTAAAVLPLILLAAGRNWQDAVQRWGVTTSTAIYVGLLLSHFVLLRDISSGSATLFGYEISGGLAWVIVVFVSTWLCDTGAYLIGRAFGRHKMTPRLSPKKTWEGMAGGTIVCVLTTIGIILLLNLNVPAWESACLGLVIAAAAQVGDLLISLMKRQTAVKDTGSIIPGHGGVLDRTDSLALAVVAVYYFVVWAGI